LGVRVPPGALQNTPTERGILFYNVYILGKKIYYPTFNCNLTATVNIL
jgi:hypothetical protein